MTRTAATSTSCSKTTGSSVWAIGNHLVGQAVCDPIDARHQGVVPPDVWGDGDPEGVRRRAADKLKDTARAAAKFGVTTVTGFTGSPTWHMLYSFPPNDFAEIERGYEEFAERFSPIIDVFDAEGVKFAPRGPPDRDRLRLRHHAQDARRARQPRGLRDQLRPEPLRAPVPRLRGVRHRVRRPDLPRARQGLDQAPRRPPLDPRLAPELRRGGRAGGTSSPPATATSTSRSSFRALNRIGYQGPLSIEWEDSGMDRDWGAPGRARVRARHGLLAVIGGVRRGVRALVA